MPGQAVGSALAVCLLQLQTAPVDLASSLASTSSRSNLTLQTAHERRPGPSRRATHLVRLPVQPDFSYRSVPLNPVVVSHQAPPEFRLRSASAFMKD